MSIEKILLWYEKNVSYKITKSFLKFLIKLGIIKNDIDLNLLNLFLLETFNNEFIKENNKFKIKENRKSVINSFKDEPTTKKDTKKAINEEITQEETFQGLIINVPQTDEKEEIIKKTPNKFKIENLGGTKLKLVKA